jgi:hypothetical protein
MEKLNVAPADTDRVLEVAEGLLANYSLPNSPLTIAITPTIRRIGG